MSECDKGFCPAKAAANNTYFVPLLPYLLAGALAFAIAGSVPHLRQFAHYFLSAGLACWLCALTSKLVFETPPSPILRRVEKLFIFAMKVLGVFAICVWYFFFRIEANPYPDFAPREMQITMRIDEVSRGANDSRYGLATILEAPSFAPKLAGMKVWYVISDGKKRERDNHDIIASQVVRMNGVLGGVYPAQAKARGYNADSENTREFERYLATRMIYFKIHSRIGDAEIIESAEPRFKFYSDVYKYMDKSLSRFPAEGMNESEAARAYQAMILGDKSRLGAEQKQSFIDTGTMHIFAISGLHVGFVAGILYGLLALLRVNWRIQPLLALPVLYVYVCACGGRPSAMRAFGMIAIVWLALAFGRGLRPFGALVIAASLSLLFTPQNVFDAGFTLSYCIVASLFVYGIPLYDYLKRYSPSRHLAEGHETLMQKAKGGTFAFLAGGLSISLGAFVAGAPLSAYYFSYVAPAAVLFSPFFVAGAGLAVGLGFGGFALPGFIAQFLNTAAVAIVWAMSESAQFGAGVFQIAMDTVRPSGIMCALSLFAFLGLSAMLEKARPALRFVLAPAAAAGIMFAGILMAR